MKKIKEKPKKFDLEKHNEVYRKHLWPHLSGCECNKRENQPGYVPVEIKPQKPKPTTEDLGDPMEDDPELEPKPLFEPEEEEDEPRFL